MKVLILCGGIGTRLKEETDFKPKPMVYIGNKPIIWHIMKYYAFYGYNDFILALGYKADYIKDFFLNQKAFTSDFTLETQSHKTKFYLNNRDKVDNFRITFVDTGQETLPGERILRCQKYIPDSDESFMVTYGDGVSDINLKNLFDFHRKQKTIGTITGVHPRTKYGIAKTNHGNLVKYFEEKPILSDWINGGYMVFQRKFLSFLKPNETEHPALIRLTQKNQLSLYKHDGFWFAIDTYKEYEELNNMWSSNNRPWQIWK